MVLRLAWPLPREQYAAVFAASGVEGGDKLKFLTSLSEDKFNALCRGLERKSPTALTDHLPDLAQNTTGMVNTKADIPCIYAPEYRILLRCIVA